MMRDEILNMPAGRGMDALIAEKVMGIDLSQECGGEMYDEDSNYWSCTSCSKEGGWNEDFQHTIQPQHYSNSINAAWGVVEKLCNESGCDIVKVCKRDPELLRGEWSCNLGRGFEAFGDTAPLAICRTALLSVLEIEQ